MAVKWNKPFQQDWTKNPYSYSMGSPSSDMVNAMADGYRRKQQNTQMTFKNDRSMVDRFLDAAVSTGYVTSGFVKGAVDGLDGDDPTDISPWEGAKQGLKASNPFGDGYEEGEWNYSRIMGDLGWEPEGFGGKALKGTTGFALDVFLDPATYLTGGLSAGIKGTGRTGKVASKLGKTADDVAKLTYKNTSERLLKNDVAGNLNRDLVDRFAKKKADDIAKKIGKPTHMTDDMAEVFVRNSTASKGLSEKAVKLESQKMAKKYNELLGIRDVNPEPITYGLKNLPFGDKIKGADKLTVTLSDGQRLRQVSDKLGVSKVYSGMREGIYGSKIGKLFSTKTPLKKIADTNPSELYKFMKFVDVTQGKHYDKVKADKLIHDRVKGFNLTPAENEEIINMLEDKSIMSKVKDTLRFSETKRGQELRSIMNDAIKYEQQHLEGLESSKDPLRQMLNDVEAKKIDSAYDMALSEDSLRTKTSAIEAERALDEKELNNMYDVKRSEYERAKEDLTLAERMVQEKNIDKFHELALKENEYRKSLEDIQIERITREEELTQVVDEIRTEANTVKKQLEEAERRVFEENQVKLRSASEPDITDSPSITMEERRTELLADIEKLKGELKEDKFNYYSFKETQRTKKAEKIYEIGEKTEFRDILKSRNKLIDESINPSHLENPGFGAQGRLSRKLSEYIYGDADVIGEGAQGESLDKLLSMVDKGKSIDEIKDFVESNKTMYSVHAHEVANEVKRRVGYKDWANKEGKRLKELANKQKQEVLSPTEQQEALKLQNMARKRQELFNRYYHDMSFDEFSKMRQDEVNKSLTDFIEREIDIDNERKRSVFYDNDSANQSRKIKDLDEPVEITSYDKAEMWKRATDDFLAVKAEKSDKFMPFSPEARREILNDNGAQMGIATVSENMEELLQTVFKKPYSELTKNQSKYLLDLAKKRADLGAKNFDVMLNGRQKVAKKELARRQELKRFEAIVDEAKIDSRVDWHDGTRMRSGRVTNIKNTENGIAFDVEVRGELQEVLARDVKKVTKNFDKPAPKQAIEQSEVSQELINRHKDLQRQLRKAWKDRREFRKQDVQTSSVFDADDVQLESVPDDVVKRTKEAQRELNKLKGKKGILAKQYNAKEQEIAEEFYNRIDKYESHILELEKESQRFSEALKTLDDFESIDKSLKHITELEEALNNDEALETWARMHTQTDVEELSNPNTFDRYGEGSAPGKPIDVDGILKMENVTFSARQSLDNISSNKKVANITRFLREAFDDIGSEEVQIGKLGKEQFEALVGSYLPHILSEDGKRHINKLKELKPHKSFLTQDLGYGVKFNPYSKSRTIEGLKLQQANDKFREALKGKNLFSDNVADLYLTRALKHNELMYDNKYMNSMMDMFGSEIPNEGVQKGFKAVANFGKLKETIREEVVQRINIARKKANSRDSFEVTNEMWEKYTNEVAKEFRLDPKLLDDLKTPMVELTPEQVNLLRPYGIARQVNDAIVLKANQARKIQITKDKNNFLSMNDKFTHFMKLNQTTVMPAFHMRNAMSNTYLNWLGTGSDAINKDFQIATKVLAKNKGDIVDVVSSRKFGHKQLSRPLNIPSPHEELKDLVNNGQLHWNTLYDLALKNGVIDEGFFAQDLGAGTGSSGILSRMTKLPSKFDPTDTENFALYKKGAEVGSTIENSDRLLHFASQLRQGKSLSEAAESSNKFLFDYSELTMFEQNVMKRVIPFYTFLRKNGRLQVSEFIEQPEKYRDTAKFLNAVESTVPDEERVQDAFLSDFAKDWIQTPFNKVSEDGKKEPILFNPSLPYLDLGRIPDPTQPKDSVRELLSQTATQIKVPLEVMANKNFFFDSDLYNEGDSKLDASSSHMANQFAVTHALSGFSEKEGLDKALHGLNTVSGLKFLSYDYETFKNMRIAEMLEEMEQEESD